jgi:inosine-uridine nucleoside N-ribohydrolase
MSPQTERSSMSRQRARVCAALLIASCATVSLASGQPQIQNSARAIPFASRSSPLAVVLIIGPGTDVASAVLQDPLIVRRIAIVAMSFNDWPGGGDGFNVKNDPLAWQVILNSDVPVVIGSGAVALRHLKLTRAEASALMQSHGSVGGYLYGLFDDWLTQRAELVARLGAPGTW